MDRNSLLIDIFILFIVCVYEYMCMCVYRGQKDPVELELQVCIGHLACYVGARIWTPGLKIVQQMFLTTEPSFQAQIGMLLKNSICLSGPFGAYL